MTRGRYGDGTRRSPITAMDFDRVDRHIKPCHKRSSTLRKAMAG